MTEEDKVKIAIALSNAVDALEGFGTEGEELLGQPNAALELLKK